MERLTTDLIGRTFYENRERYLVTDRQATTPGCGVVRKLHGASKLIEMPFKDIARYVQVAY